MASQRVEILRAADAGRIDALRKAGEFFWLDVAAADLRETAEIGGGCGLSEETMRSLASFEPGGPPSRRVHIEAGLVVFPFWVCGQPDAPPTGGARALNIFRVNVLLHGDFLLTAHEHEFDLPGLVAPEGIPEGRTERYAIYIALDGMLGTMLEALADIELEVGGLEQRMLDAGLRLPASDKRMIQSLRSRLTAMRLRLGPELGVIERIGEEIEQITTLEPDKHEYFGRVAAQIGRTVNRIDAASEALSDALQVQLNETNYRLTLVATIFLPLTLIVGFFGMNFGWMVDHIDSAGSFWLLGIGAMLVALVVILLLIEGQALRDRLGRLRR
jgi:magnesium transporter